MGCPGMPAGVGAWEKTMSSGREIRRGRPLGSIADVWKGAGKAAIGVLLQTWG